jgi:deazaflavin-dependent oxidoreductase (nitroreductase family)
LPEKIRDIKPPIGFRRLFFRSPILLYKIGLAWIFGDRMLLLNHIGRKTDLPRQAVLEVVHHDDDTDVYIVNVGFGKESQWFQNIQVNPQVNIQVGQRRLDVHAKLVPEEDGGDIILKFSQDYPNEAKFVGWLGYKVDGTDEDWRALGKQMTFIAFHPR